MRKVKILEKFEGYPDSKKKHVYEKGSEHEVSDTFADLIIGKKHAKAAEEVRVAPKVEEKKK